MDTPRDKRISLSVNLAEYEEIKDEAWMMRMSVTQYLVKLHKEHAEKRRREEVEEGT